MILRKFKHDDWYGLSGAEYFKDGSEPMIADLDNMTIVVDGYGLCILVSEGEEEYYFDTEDNALAIAMGEMFAAGQNLEVIKALLKKR